MARTSAVLRGIVLILSGITLSACTAGRVDWMTPTPLPAQTSPPVLARPSPSPPVSPTPPPAADTPLPIETPRVAQPLLCSPLQDISVEQLQQMISNPFHPPPLGSDDPHQGVDFADRLNGDQMALEGRPVRAVLSGKVAALTVERFPYGNAILIETRLEEIPREWQAQLQIPNPAPTLAPHPVLTCPRLDTTPVWDGEERSLYLMYAHLKEPAGLRLDESVGCGQEIGAIGSSGNALNPHLHLETRVGPSGARFASLAHYDSSATAEEMSNYCTWRVSNLFQLIDPMRLFSVQP